jgi:DNA-binding FrmR family transcriptional regulator
MKVVDMVQDPKAELIRRLKRIEGQTRGVQKMVEEERNCAEILHQLTAINEAVRSASLMLAEQYAVQCLQVSGKRGKSREAITAMLDAIARVPR